MICSDWRAGGTPQQGALHLDVTPCCLEHLAETTLADEGEVLQLVPLDAVLGGQ